MGEIRLRPYQEEGMNAVRRLFGREKPPHAVLLVAPTGAGKGTLAAYALIEAAKKGSRSLFIVHRREIIEDVHKRLTLAGAHAGMLLAGAPKDPTAPVQVCSIDTLNARGERPPANFIFWDEAHHCVARSYRELRAAYPRAKHLGATATPMRADNSALGNVFEEMIVVAKTSELIEGGFLVPCALVTPGRHLGSNIAQHPVLAYEENGENKRAFVFVSSVPAALAVAAAFNERGISAVAIHGKTPKFIRQRQIEMFREGHVRVIVNVDTMTEGVDVSQAKVCILAKKFESPGRYLQSVGRILRPDETEGNGIVIDLCGNHIMHGLPTDDIEPGLSGEPIKNAFRNEPLPIPCPNSCGAIVRSKDVSVMSRGCPKCGWKKQLQSVLPEITNEQLVRYEPYEQMHLDFELPTAAQ